VALVAAEMLDAGDWQSFAPDELHIYRDGMQLAEHRVPIEHDTHCL
jgi:hypothetical protein